MQEHLGSTRWECGVPRRHPCVNTGEALFRRHVRCSAGEVTCRRGCAIALGRGEDSAKEHARSEAQANSSKTVIRAL